MSDVKPLAKRTVKIKENDLVDLIDNIVNEAVAVKKQEWINEQAKLESEKNNVLAERIAKLEEQFKKINESK